MTEKPNFFKLGIFVLVALMLIVAGLILFGSGAFGKKKIYFETSFADPVDGLARGSSVLLNGVEIGVVERVTFVRNTYGLEVDSLGISKYDQHINVVCSAVEEDLPIYEVDGRQERLKVYIDRGFRLRMASNIITGQSYLEAVFLDTKRYPATKVPWETQYSYIPSAPSTFSSMQESVDKILVKIEEIEINSVVDNLNNVLESMNKAVVDANIGSLSSDVGQLVRDANANMEAMSDKIQKLVSNVDKTLTDADLEGLIANIDAFVTEFRETNKDLQKLIESPDSGKDMANIPVLVDNLNNTVSGVDNLIVSETPEIREIMENIRQLSENLNYLTESLKDNPSELLFSAPPKKEK